MNNIDFTKGKIFPSMLKFSLPLIAAIVLQALYGAVDLMIVGQFGNPSSVAAVATGSHIMQTITGIITGFTMGITVIIGRFIGSNESEKVGAVVGNVAIIFSIFAVVVTIFMMSLSSVFTRLMQVPAEAFTKCVNYILICSAGSIFIIAYNVISGIFRGLGNSNLPLLFIAIACVVNIAFDLLFVGLLKMDAEGAALATVLAQAISVFFSLLMMKKKKDKLHLSKQNFRLDKHLSGKIFKIGAPIALQDGLTNVSFLIIHSFINAMGVAESASVGIAEKLFVMLAIIPMAYMSTLATIVAQNDGAGLKRRSNIALIECMAISFIFGLATFFFTHFGGDILAKIFTTDEDVIYQTIQYLNTSGYEYLIVSVMFCLLGYFNGKGKTIFVMAQGLISTFLFRIPLAYHFSHVDNSSMYLIGISIPVSAGVALVLCMIYFVILQLKDKKSKNKLTLDNN